MKKRERNSRAIEMLFWSIAFPGFGQFLNGKLIKGIVLIFLEFVINVQANLNTVIVYSFHGEINKAIQQVDYQWIMFYPCIYMFAIWDAYKDAGGGGPYAFLPFVFAAYFGTIGVIYSSEILGPIWLPITFLILGSFIGFGIKGIINWRKNEV